MFLIHQQNKSLSQKVLIRTEPHSRFQPEDLRIEADTQHLWELQTQIPKEANTGLKASFGKYDPPVVCPRRMRNGVALPGPTPGDILGGVPSEVRGTVRVSRGPRPTSHTVGPPIFFPPRVNEVKHQENILPPFTSQPSIEIQYNSQSKN